MKQIIAVTMYCGRRQAVGERKPKIHRTTGVTEPRPTGAQYLFYVTSESLLPDHFILRIQYIVRTFGVQTREAVAEGS